MLTVIYINSKYTCAFLISHTQTADRYIYTYSYRIWTQRPHATTLTNTLHDTNRERKKESRKIRLMSKCCSHTAYIGQLYANISNQINSLLFFLLFFFFCACSCVFSVISNIQMSDAFGLSRLLIYCLL